MTCFMFVNIIQFGYNKNVKQTCDDIKTVNGNFFYFLTVN